MSDHLERARDKISLVAQQIESPDLKQELHHAMMLILHEETIREDNREIIEYIKGPFQDFYTKVLTNAEVFMNMQQYEGFCAAINEQAKKFKEFGDLDIAHRLQQIVRHYPKKKMGVDYRIYRMMSLERVSNIIYRRYGVDVMV